MQKLKKLTCAKSTGELGVLPLETFQKTDDGLKNIVFENVNACSEEMLQPKPYDTLWLASKFIGIYDVPGWKGYMHSITTSLFSAKTKIIPLPFINSPPSDYNTLYTALHYAGSLCDKFDQKCLVVTFDQPLYIKSKEIVAAASSESRLSKCVVRLGGFHLLMSYIGSIGFLMSGSGLQELMSTLYARFLLKRCCKEKLSLEQFVL